MLIVVALPTSCTPAHRTAPKGPRSAGRPDVVSNSSTREAPPKLTISAPAPVAPARRVLVPSVGIDAEVGRLSVAAVADPRSLPGSRAAVIGDTDPGMVGVATLGGHNGPAGVFGRLGEVPIGAEVVVIDAKGDSRRFVVRARGVFAKGDIPPALWGVTTVPTLLLVSCTNRQADGWSPDTIVLRATPA